MGTTEGTGRRGFRAGYWVVAVSTAGFVATAPGQTFVMSQLNLSLREEFGIGELALNGAYTAATVLAALPLVWVGRLTDRIGVRRMLVWTALACGVGCGAMAGAQGLATLFLGFFLLRFLAQGALSLVSQHALAMWFHRRLGAMHGFKQVIVFASWALVPQLALVMIHGLGWRWTYVVFGAGIWLLVIPAAWFLVRDRPEEIGLRMDGDELEPGSGEAEGRPGEDRAERLPASTPLAVAPVVVLTREVAFTLGEALRTPTYWILASAICLGPLVATAILFDIQPMLAARGLEPRDAALAVSAWSVSMAAVAIPAGLLTDRFSPRVLLPVGVGLVVTCCLVLLGADSRPEAALGLVLFGLGQGMVATVSVATLARTFGRAHHGAIRSSVTRLAVVATGLGPSVTGLSAHFSGSYRPALLLFILLSIPVALAAASLGRPRSAARIG